jgi:tricarballylate dehydrogenase
MIRTSKGRCDKEKIEVMFDHALETVTWMNEKGMKWQLTLNKFFDKKRVAKASVSGVFNMPPGDTLMAMHEGVGLTDDLWAAVEKTDIKVLYSTPVCELLTSGDAVSGVRTRQQESFVDFEGQVILACGGFEASPRLKRQYLGEGWDLVVVRGSRFNTGTIMESAIASGAGVAGHWGGCHSKTQDLNAPKVGDLAR